MQNCTICNLLICPTTSNHIKAQVIFKAKGAATLTHNTSAQARTCLIYPTASQTSHNYQPIHTSNPSEKVPIPITYRPNPTKKDLQKPKTSTSSRRNKEFHTHSRRITSNLTIQWGIIQCFDRSTPHHPETSREEIVANDGKGR